METLYGLYLLLKGVKTQLTFFFSFHIVTREKNDHFFEWTCISVTAFVCVCASSLFGVHHQEKSIVHGGLETEHQRNFLKKIYVPEFALWLSDNKPD